MKKLLSVIFVLILIITSSANAFADDSTLIDPVLGVVQSGTETLSDGTIREVFAWPRRSPVNGDKISIVYSNDRNMLEKVDDNKEYRYSFSIQGDEGVYISRVAVKVSGQTILISGKTSSAGYIGATFDTNLDSSEITVGMSKNEEVQKLDFSFETPGNPITFMVNSIVVEYKYDYTHYLTVQRDNIAKKISDAEKAIVQKQNSVAAEIKKLQDDIAEYKIELEAAEAKLAAQTGTQNSTNGVASIMTKGSFTIATDIVCLAVGFLIAMVIFRKKQSGKSTENNSEE